MKIAIHTLGCKVNQYESEAIKGRFLEADGEIVGEEEYADVYNKHVYSNQSCRQKIKTVH